LPSDRPPRIEGGLNVIGGAGTLVATGEVVRLDQVAARDGLTVADQIALHDAQLRQSMAGRIVRAFVQANAVMLAALGALVLLDEINILLRLVSPGDRIITPQVFMTLVGATTVQVGAIAAIIARYLFPGRVRDG
jgi:hypothetical protein